MSLLPENLLPFFARRNWLLPPARKTLSLGDEMTECLLLPLPACPATGGGTISPTREDPPILWYCGPEVGMWSGGRCIVSHWRNTLSGTVEGGVGGVAGRSAKECLN